MKTRFNTYDIICSVTELQRLVGMRVNQVYDIDNKAYLIRLQRSEEKSVLLLESANRFHTTHFEWPKNVAPSGFTMKLRKHLKNKRLEKLSQIGVDRIVDFQFGTGEAAYHVILELYDRGNIVLTDYDWTILNVLRPHVEGDKIRFAVKEKYPLDRAKMSAPPPTGEALKQILSNSKPGDNLKKILNPNLEYGPSIIDHVLAECGLASTMRLVTSDGTGFNVERDFDKLESALALAEQMLEAASKNIGKGYIIQKKEERPNPTGDGNSFLLTNQEFHPMYFAQHRGQPYQEYETFDRAVDEFFSTLEGQKIDMKAIQVEREAMKKLQNVRKDHDKRLTELQLVQRSDRDKAELITRNQELVDKAILAIRSAIANQMSWDDIRVLVKNAQINKDPVASCIKHLKLEMNHITLLLTDPYGYDDSDNSDDQDTMKPLLVDVDLALTAYANARRYYDQKRSAAVKQQKTLDAQGKALKSAERKTKQTLKEMQAITSINKARKSYWFEKFFWFISSENYLVIGGRDQQQNELLVKRYMRAGDVYVHADVAGASSIIVKNPTGAPVPPKTLNEAGQVAVAYSVAWDAKVLTAAWWVHASQVSKSAPTGEYLSTGSFMIRGKKNYLLPSHLMLGFSFMFRLEESSIERHRDERKVLSLTEEPVEQSQPDPEEQEIVVSDDDEENPKDDEKLDTIIEQAEKVEIRDEENVAIETEPEETQESKTKEGESDENQDSDSSGSENFPDTHIKVDHGTGKVMLESKTRTMSEMTDDSKDEPIFLGDDKPLTFPSLPQKNARGSKKPQSGKKGKENPKEQAKKESGGLKRGQKSKLKKIKEKYKDQDLEERQLWIEHQQTATAPKDSKKAQKKQAVQNAIASGSAVKGKSKNQQKIPMPTPVLLEADDDEEVADNEPEPEPTAAGASSADSAVLGQLTGCPLPEDELLFAVPVIAPYSVMHNYKFKVKLTPGTGKRGKAAKTAVQVFLKDKLCSAREKDLLKAVKDEDIARNFPGKVKLSAPQLQKHKK